MSIKAVQFPLVEGLNLEAAHSQKNPGSTYIQINFEAIYGKQGYYRIGGYDRYDGRDAVHTHTYATLPFADGTSEVVVGDFVSGGASVPGHEVIAVTVTSGDWATSDAAGEIRLAWNPARATITTGIFVGATQVADAVSEPVIGSPAFADYAARLPAAQAAQRARMTQPGGSIAGMHVWGDRVIVKAGPAIRRTTASGWLDIQTGLIEGGKFRALHHNFGGSTATMSLYAVDGRNGLMTWNPVTGAQYVAPWFGTNATSTTSTTIGTGSKSITVVEDARSWADGQDVTIWSRADRANFMRGTVTSWDSGTKTLVVDVTSVDGSGTFTDWEVGLSDFSDKPYLITTFGSRLVMAFPGGQLQLSDADDPLVSSVTGALIGVGDEIVDIVELVGGVLAIFCRGSIYLLTGRTTETFDLQVVSKDTGARENTVQSVGANVLFVSERGLTSLVATQTFGDFQVALVGAPVASYLKTKLSKIRAAKIFKRKMQYRVYFDDGTGLTATFTQDSQLLGTGRMAFSVFNYLDVPVAAAGGERDNGDEIQFFATEDGWVMLEDEGPSFAGEPVPSFLHTAFGNYQSASQKKRFRLLGFEIDAEAGVAFNVRQYFDGQSPYYQPGDTAVATAIGGYFDLSDWDTFVWSGQVVSDALINVSGVGKTMSLLIWHESDTDPGFGVQSVIVHYSPLGIQR